MKRKKKRVDPFLISARHTVRKIHRLKRLLRGVAITPATATVMTDLIHLEYSLQACIDEREIWDVREIGSH